MNNLFKANRSTDSKKEKFDKIDRNIDENVQMNSYRNLSSSIGYGKSIGNKSNSKKDLGKSNSELSVSKSQSISRINASKDYDYGFNENESLIDKYIQSQNNIQVPSNSSNANGFARNNKKYS